MFIYYKDVIVSYLLDKHRKRYPILVPYWIAKQINRNKLSYDVIFDLAKLSTVCSKEDLATMLCLNTNLKHSRLFVGPAEFYSSLYGVWDTVGSDANKLFDLAPLVDSKIKERLCIEQGNNTLSSEYPNPFEIRSINSAIGDDHALMIIIYPGHFGGFSTRQIQKQLVREYLKQSYVFSEYDAVAKDPLYLQYVRSL